MWGSKVGSREFGNDSRGLLHRLRCQQETTQYAKTGILVAQHLIHAIEDALPIKSLETAASATRHGG
jgi:hypothetical protein